MAGRVVRASTLSARYPPSSPWVFLCNGHYPHPAGARQLDEISEIVAPPMVAGKPRLRASPNAMIEPLPVAIQ